MAKHKAEESSFKLVPEDEYQVRISKIELHKGKNDKKAQVAHFTFTVRKGKKKGSVVKDFFNMKNKNQQAVDIAHGELSHLAWCCGMKGFDDQKLQKFKGYDLKIDVSIDGKYNRIEKYMPMTGKQDSKKKGKNKKPW